MLDKKKVQSIRARIKKDQSSLSAFGAMTLSFEFDAMTVDQLTYLRDALLNSRSPLSYEPLNATINRRLGA